MQLSFNTYARNERILDEVNRSVEKIQENWEKGISVVDLEASTDIFREVRKGIQDMNISGLGFTYVTNKGLSVQKKNNVTTFRIKNMNV